MELGECKNKGYIRLIRINTALVRSLIEMSEVKLKVVSKVALTEENVSAYFPMAYDALREVLEAFSVLHGYKVTSHECLGLLIKELFKDFDYVQFDRFRFARNGINYYGKRIALEEGKELIEKMIRMRNIILKEVEKKMEKISFS